MKKIYKYTLDIVDKQVIEIPQGFYILSLKVQNGKICLWVIVDPDNESEKIHFAMVGTGVDLWCYSWYFIDTVLLNSGDLVFHVFYKRGE